MFHNMMLIFILCGSGLKLETTNFYKPMSMKKRKPSDFFETGFVWSCGRCETSNHDSPIAWGRTGRVGAAAQGQSGGERGRARGKGEERIPPGFFSFPNEKTRGTPGRPVTGPETCVLGDPHFGILSIRAGFPRHSRSN